MKLNTILLFVVTLIILSISCKAQDIKDKRELRNTAQLLKQINSVPYIPELSGDSLFWVVVKYKKDIIPYLIELLNDTTELPIPVPNFGGNYTVADVSNMALQKIIPSLPTSSFLNKILENNGYGDYWVFVRNNYTNRILYQKRLSYWYEKNQKRLVWFKDTTEYRTSFDWKFSNYHPAGGYYILE